MVKYEYEYKGDNNASQLQYLFDFRNVKLITKKRDCLYKDSLFYILISPQGLIPRAFISVVIVIVIDI